NALFIGTGQKQPGIVPAMARVSTRSAKCSMVPPRPTLRPRITQNKMCARILAALLLGASALVTPAVAIELTEPEGAAHGYPGLCDLNGKKLADGEFRQWVQDDKLHVVITYRFPDGQLYEEKALFRQRPELIQEQWSWRELKGGRPQREFAADFVTRIGSAHIRKENETKDVSKNIDVELGRTFAGF